MSISAAANAAGVSRQTASKWVARAREEGIAHLSERSRRPLNLRPSVESELERQILLFAAQHPAWGAKKLHAGLWPPEENQSAPLCARTIGRILARAQLTNPNAPSREGAPPQHFERLLCNALWQLDFKGLEHLFEYRPLSILDDASRFCLGLFPVLRVGARTPDQRPAELLWEPLWQVFGEWGLPDAILCDNGDGFNGSAGVGLTPFEMRLARLGIRVVHGRPYHPQTQGKVERFHRTLEAEWPHLLRVSPDEASLTLETARQEYNWLRPHEALGGRKPGSVYTASLRQRPAQLPPAFVSDEGQKRRVDANGYLSFHGKYYRVGRGLCGEWLEVREQETPDPAQSPKTQYTAFYCGQPLDTLENIGAKGSKRIPTSPPQGVKDVLS
jgi:transposase InsO family protein